MSQNTLKEYLISLGFGVDDNQYNTAMKKMKGFENSAGKVAGNIGKTMAKGATVATAALFSITTGVITYLDSVAKADMATEKFARRMWMTETNARGLQNSLKAMGESMDSVYDVAANPELRAKFLKLRADAARLEGGPEIDQGLQEIRDFQFEFQRLKLMISYGGRYIAYYLSKYLGEPMAQIKAKLRSINDDGQNVVQVWGERIARVLSYLIRLFGAGVQAGLDLIKLFRRLPVEVKVAAAAIAAVGMMMLNPFTAVIMAIGAALLLLEDFYTWKNGGQSLFGGMWEDLSKLKFENKSLPSFVKLLDSLKDLFVHLREKWLALDKAIRDATGLSIMENVLKGIDWFIGSILDGLTAIVDLINQLLDGDAPEWLKNTAYGLSGTNPLELQQNQEKLDYWRQKLHPEEQKPAAPETPAAHPAQAPAQMPHLPMMTLPSVFNPYTSSVTNQNKKTDINVDESIKNDVKINVTGTDAAAIGLGINEVMAHLMQRHTAGWSQARIPYAQ